MRNFRLLWLGTSISSLGTWLLIVAVPVHLYQTTGSALATSAALAVESLPAVILGPWAGVLADRWDRRLAMAGASTAAAFGVALMLLDWIYLGLLAESVAAVLLVPASRALLPAITGTGPALAKANTLMAVTSSATRMTGPLLGTFVYLQGGLTLVVILDIASYLVAALAVLAIRMPSIRRAEIDAVLASRVSSIPPAESTAAVASDMPPAQLAESNNVWRELVEGFQYIKHSSLVRGLLLSSCAFWTANAGLTALLVPFLVAHLGADGSALGYLITALGLGYLAGSALCRWLLLRPPAPILTAAFTAAGVCFLVMFTATSLPVTIAAAFLVGIPGAIITTVVPHTVQANVPDSLLGRTSSAFWASDALAALVGAILAGALSMLVGLDVAVIIFSAAATSIGLVTRITLRVGNVNTWKAAQ